MNKSSRLLSIGASEINTLMNGSEKEIHELWLIKTKQKKEPDLTNPKECDNWFQVILGTLTESLNLTAFEYNFPDLPNPDCTSSKKRRILFFLQIFFIYFKKLSDAGIIPPSP